MRHDLVAIKKQIVKALPPGLVVTEHDERGHWYRINDKEAGSPLYPSVTGKLQILKDEGLANWKMARALEYIFANFHTFTNDNIMDHIGKAERVSADIFEAAGDIGTFIHGVRELIFNTWIATGERPKVLYPFIDEHIKQEEEKGRGGLVKDLRAVSAIAALEKFCTDYHYQPIACELMVYSHKWQVAGMLDDLGLMRVEKRKGDPSCEHDIIEAQKQNIDRCVKCDAKWEWALVVIDMKTSNRFKDHFYFQVGMYWRMFVDLTGLRPQHCFIVKLSKENRTYSLEELKRPGTIARYANNLLRVNEGMEMIKSIRKDNQRRVVNL